MSDLFRKATPSDFQLHTPLPWPLYDEHGTLLLRQGYVISMPGMISRLLARVCYIGPPNTDAKHVDLRTGEATQKNRARATSSEGPVPGAREKTLPPVFVQTLNLVPNVRRIHKLLREAPSAHIEVHAYIRERAQTLTALLEHDWEAVLAALYLSTDSSEYRPSQQLMGAALMGLLAPSLGFDAAQTQSLVCAGLTRDAGLAQFDELSAQFLKGVPDQARKIITAHPSVSVRLLQNHGVEDALWLKAIEQHHERPDGQGYPEALSEAQIEPGGRLLALADAYASMVLRSEHSKSQFPANALKELFLEKNKRYDEKQVSVLFKTLTRFPAGTLLSLKNGEIGIVYRSGEGGPPQVYGLYEANGSVRSLPVPRDITQEAFEILGCVPPETCKSAQLVIRRLWQKPSTSA